MVPIEKDYYTHPMQVFRRRRALHHPPDCCASIAGTSLYDIFCTVQDNLLVVRQWTKEALALPSGVMFNVYELLNEPHLYPGPHPEALEYLQTVYTALPDGCVAFVHREHPSRLVVQSLLENKSRVWKIHRDKSVVARRILGDRSIAAAGDDAQWVVFYSSERCITVSIWTSGRTDDMSVVGLVREREVGWLKEVVCPPPLNKNCEVVLRSRDKLSGQVVPASQYNFTVLLYVRLSGTSPGQAHVCNNHGDCRSGEFITKRLLGKPV